MEEADLSEHFGSAGEFLLGLLGLLLLALMHPECRRHIRAGVKAISNFIARVHRAVEGRSFVYRCWSAAFTLIFCTRRDLLLVLASLIVFDHAAKFYDGAVRRFLIHPLLDKHSWNNPVVTQVTSLHSYSLMAITLIGSVLFCWLAYQRTKEIQYDRAAKFRPLGEFAGFALCLAGVIHFTATLSPSLFYFTDWVRDPESVIFVFGFLAASSLVAFIGAILLRSRDKAQVNENIFAAFVGYFLLTQLLQWLNQIQFPIARPPATPWIWSLQTHLTNFTNIALSDIVLLAFSVVLAGVLVDRARLPVKRPSLAEGGASAPR